MSSAFDLAYVRTEEEPVLPPPRGRVGRIEAIYANLFSSITNIVLTVIGLALVIVVVPPIIRWAFVDAVWSGGNRDACIAPEAGACWAFVKAKFAQFMYGRYPIEERWRVDLTAVLLIVGLAPMAIPRVPFKRENAFYLLAIFPLIALILLTGGNFSISGGAFRLVAALCCLAVGLAALFVANEPAATAMRALAATAAVLGILALIAAVAAGRFGPLLFGMTILDLAVYLLALIALVAGIAAILVGGGPRGALGLLPVAIAMGVVLLLFLILRTDFGLPWVETPLWGGLLITLVVAIVGIVGSMPLGILLALGRRSV